MTTPIDPRDLDDKELNRLAREVPIAIGESSRGFMLVLRALRITRKRLAEVERREGELRPLVARLAHIPLRDCPWGCDDDGHRDGCPVGKAQRALSESTESAA